MKKDMASLIVQSRSKQDLTQDLFGRKYDVSGPAIFKFEKGYVKPSLELWLSMVADMDITEQEAVLLWVRSKLPKKYQDFLSVDPAVAGKSPKPAKKRNPEQVRTDVMNDSKTPKGLKAFLKDNDLWALYKPTAEEIDTLRNVFGPMGPGSKTSFREALRLVRAFGKR